MIVIGVGIGIVLSIVICLAVSAWGVVQVLDVMEALDLRREAKRRKLQEARKYLTNPEAYEKQYTNTWQNSNMTNTMSSMM